MCLFFKYKPYLSPMHILPPAFMCIVSHAAPGSKTPFDERYNAFFIDYSLTPLLVQHNYIDSAKNGIFKNPGLDDVTRMQMLSRASDAVSDRWGYPVRMTLSRFGACGLFHICCVHCAWRISSSWAVQTASCYLVEFERSTWLLWLIPRIPTCLPAVIWRTRRSAGRTCTGSC
jgi:hypothetical protein